MSFLQIQQEITFTTHLKLLRISPASKSLITSLGVSLFHSCSKNLYNPESLGALNSLYSFYPQMRSWLDLNSITQPLDDFQNFCEHISEYKNITSEVILAPNSQFSEIIYTVFSAVYSIIFSLPLYSSQPWNLSEHMLEIKQLCESLSLNLIVYSDSGQITSFSSGLLVELYSDSENGFSVILERSQNYIEKPQISAIDSLLACVSLPKTLREWDMLCEWIAEFQAETGTNSVEMQKILDERQSWKCKHDHRKIRLSCQHSHCIYCLFEIIKDLPPEMSMCNCKNLLSKMECDKVFAKVQPKFNRVYQCEHCKIYFKIESSVKCANDFICISCRSRKLKKCIGCDRGYSEDEFAMLSNNFGIKKQTCDSCGVNMTDSGKGCKEGCKVCKDCHRNTSACFVCKAENEEIQKMQYRCVNCKENVKKIDCYFCKCKYPVHKGCKGKCKNCDRKKKKIIE